MCVIAIADKVRPSDKMIEAMYNTNQMGAGIAWREGVGEDRKVHWEKGLDLVDVTKRCREVPMPYIVHFRIATVGGKREALCHPFPIDRQVPLNLKGSTKGFVLFHNGHWNDWKQTMLKSVVGTTFKIPGGKWSDSRAMAWMAAHFQLGVLELIDEKCVAFGPGEGEMEIISGTSGWSLVEQVWVSNRYWEHKLNPHIGTYGSFSGHGAFCRERSCTRKDLDLTGYCPEHTTVTRQPGEADKKEKKVEDAGGSSSETPFGQMSPIQWMQAQEQAFKDNRLSKKKLKRARKTYDRWLEALKQQDVRVPAVILH